MKYRSFTINNYKGIEDLTIDLNKSLNEKVFTFVGLNESGKTSILEAINLIQKNIDKKDAHKLIPKKLKANFTGSVHVQATIDVDEADNNLIKKHVTDMGFADYQKINAFIISVKVDFINSEYVSAKNTWNISIMVKTTKQKKYYSLFVTDKEKWLKVIEYIKNNLMPRIIYYENFLFDIPERIYLNGSKAEDPENIEYKDIIQDIIHSVYPSDTIENLIVNRLINQTAASKEALESVMLKISNKITKDVFTNWSHLFGKNNSKIIFSVDKDDDESCYLGIKIQEGDESFNVSERSLGFRWFFAFLFFTIFRKNRETDLGETLFLLDEPASNLHSTAQKKLLLTFEEFVADKCKLIYTTHSHHLINPKWLNSAYIVKNNAIDYTNISSDTNATNITAMLYKQFVAEHPNQQDYFQPILDILDYQPGLLEKIPNIIITEGKNDYYTLKYINEVILDNKYKKIHLFPGAGCTKNNTVITLYMAWNKGFLVLLDGDKAGKTSKRKYVSSFGDFINSNIKTYDDIVLEIGDSMMEDIFNVDEKLTITKMYNDKYIVFNKSAFNSFIQSALMSKTKIELSKQTIDKFDKLLKALNTYDFKL